MRLLIFLLALMSAFFVFKSHADTEVPEGYPSNYIYPPIPAETVKIYVLECKVGSTTHSLENPDVSTLKSQCMSLAKPISSSDGCSYTPKNEILNPFVQGNISFRSKKSNDDAVCKGHQQIYYKWRSSKTGPESCPPKDNPDFDNPIIWPAGSEILNCAKLKDLTEPEPSDCPAGYHSKAVSKALGSTECVPKECPPAGSGEALYSSPNLGVPFSGGGMYCNDGCAYSVSSANITSDKHATGTSQGAACGDKPYDNKKLADESDADKCSTATNGDVTILSCTDATPTNDGKDPHNNDESKVDDTPTSDKPKLDCAEGDTICNLKNLEIQMQNSSQQTIDNQKELHNKQIEAQTKNTNAIINAMDSVDTSIFLQTQQDERLHAVTISKFNELIGAVNGIDVGTGGGGGGSGTGTGTGEPDCEGSAADCVPIEAFEIPSETVNLQQYSDKYDDWLPNAELPEQSCVTLTNGLNLCLDFSSIILIFKAFSALLVISALIHSGKIIAGAF